MVLSGALKEFILGDIFNLLTLQKATGRLVLSDDRREGGIVFKDGIIVGADCGDENLPNKLFNYMVGIKRKSPDHVSQLFNANAGNLSQLASNIIERNLMTQKELKTFAESCVEDICCSLLNWTRGTYRFNSQRSVASAACGSVTIPAENIIMEGMRRIDEWARMQEYIQDQMIFVPAIKGGAGRDSNDEFDVNAAPEEYILSLLDGSCTVGSIKKSCCLCEYKVFESINILLQTQRITALHQKYTQSIQAALKRKEAENEAILNKGFIGSAVSVAAALVFAAVMLFCRLYVIPESARSADDAAAGTPDAVRAAVQLHYATTGEQAGDPAALKEAGLLTDRDL
ncbi:MAG: DUF4388 domain-containing protein [Chitinispirillia bacterium]|nr:DUF4388 domain-containing protein [Chitinispirillia bacterium]MCL2268648.1 DUF4388 domain-containing protein [Chitinispirillia bacterium]